MKKLFLLLCLPLFLITCSKEDSQPALPSQYQDLADVFDGAGIGGIIALDFNHLLLVNSTGDRYAWFTNDQVQKEWDLRDPNGPLKNYPSSMNGLGTGMVLTWISNPNRLFLISDDGTSYTSGDIIGDLDAPAPWNNADQFYLDNFRALQDTKPRWGANGTFPMNDIGACMKTNYVGCLNDVQIEPEQYLLVNRAGTRVMNYIVDGLVNRPAFDVGVMNNYVSAGCSPEDYVVPFSRIGAASLYERSNGQLEIIYFSTDGKSFAFYNEQDQQLSNIYSF